MAATGLLTAVLWISGVGVLLATGIGTGTFGFLFAISLLCMPLGIFGGWYHEHAKGVP